MKSKVYLCPYNDITLKLSKDKSFLEEYEVIGFVDNYKEKKILIRNLSILKFDYIIVCSPNYYLDIYRELLNSKINKNKILFYINNTNEIKDNIDNVNFTSYNNIQDYDFIKKLKNKHLDKKIFLIGNGPSLKIEDLDFLKNEITFAANKIYLAYKKTKWRPTYYLVEDDLVYKQNYNKIKNLKESIKLFPEYSLNWNKKINDAYYFKLIYLPNMENFPSFEPNPIKGIYWGSTVIYTMIQWAVYLGCKEIYLLGIDFDFVEPNNYVINQDNRKDLICEGEVNHFHKEYRKVGEKWNLPNLDIQLQSFNKAKEYCDKNGIKIFNASRTTKLNIFKKINLKKKI